MKTADKIFAITMIGVALEVVAIDKFKIAICPVIIATVIIIVLIGWLGFLLGKYKEEEQVKS